MERIDAIRKLYPLHISEKNVAILNDHPADEDEIYFRVVPVGNGKAYVEGFDPDGSHVLWM